MASRRTLIYAAALVGLIAAVAVASRGHAPAGAGTAHGVDGRLIWEFVLLALAAVFIVSLPLTLLAVLAMRGSDPHASTRRWRRATIQVTSLVALVALGLLWELHRYGEHKTGGAAVSPRGGGTATPVAKPSRPIPFDWLPAVVVLVIAVAAAGVVAYLALRRPAHREPTPAELAAQLSAVLDESLDDLRSETDPRRAVIATYARMERTLAGFGFPRAVAEAPLEYLARVLQDLLQTSAEAVTRLTALFERAKFSPHEIDPGMKHEAIDALVAVRDELRAASA